VTDQNPFGDMDRVFQRTLEIQLETVRAIDGLDQDLNTWESTFLDSVIKQLENEKRPLSQKQLEVVRRLCEQYDVECDL